MHTTTTPAPPQVGPVLIHSLTQALGGFVSHFWWLILIVAAAGAARGIAWLLAERRLSRSGIDEIDAMGGVVFERRLAHLFSSLGYRVEQTRALGDFGADLILERDGVRTVVQAKRWKKNVGIKAVQEAVASKPMYRCDRAMVVTNRYFTPSAKRLAKANHVTLWNRDDLIRALLRSDPTAVPALRPSDA